MPRPQALRSVAITAAVLVAAACGSPGGGGAAPIGGITIVPELLACRARVNNAMSFTEIALRTAQNLGTDRLADRSGIERRVRLHPFGNTVVFARERANSDPNSRELFTAVIDGSSHELRLTLDGALDDEPCWSPTGDAILFASERGGDKSLWLMDPDGKNVRVFLTAPGGATDGEPDWSTATDRIVFSRRDASGAHRLWLVQGDGTGLTVFTDGGGAATTDLGDRDPAFAPDGNTVLFARRSVGGVAALCSADVATGAVTTLYQTAGEIGLPRFAPLMDRIFFGLSEPGFGRDPLRLAVVAAGGGTPTLVWPDERYVLEGLDILPGMPAAPAPGAALPLDVTEAEVQIAWGSTVGLLTKSSLALEDGNEFTVRTNTSSTREIAGINCVFALPVDDPLDVVELRIRAVARLSRIGGDTELRMSIFNTVDSRFDTAVEIEPLSTGLHTMTFTTSSLRHISSARQLRVTVIGDVEHGDRADLSIDLVEVSVVARS